MNNWPERYAEFWKDNPAPILSAQGAIRQLEKHLARLKQRREYFGADDESYAGDKLAYLRGPGGQHDRETIWKAGAGRIGGEGGFLP